MTWIDTEIVWGQTSKHWGCLCRRVSTSYMHCLMIFQSPGILALAYVFVMTGTTTFSKQDHLIVKSFFFLRGASRPEQLDQANQLTVYKQKHQWNFREGQEGPRAPRQRHRLAYPIPCPQLVFCFNSKNVRNLRCKAMSNLNFNSRCCKREVNPLTT